MEQSAQESWSHIKLVQHLIESSLQQHMSQEEVVSSLEKAGVEPALTRLVWEKLEDSNPEFFAAYKIQLKVKDQMIALKYLVDQQMQLMTSLAMAQSQQEMMAAFPPAADVGGLPLQPHQAPPIEDHGMLGFDMDHPAVDLGVDAVEHMQRHGFASPDPIFMAADLHHHQTS